MKKNKITLKEKNLFLVNSEKEKIPVKSIEMITNDKFLVTFYDNTKVSKDIQKAIFMMNIEQKKNKNKKNY